MKFAYKLVNKNTNEIATYGNDNTTVFGGPWGETDSAGKIYVWQENTPTKSEQYAEINAKYTAEIDGIREAIRFMSDMGKSPVALQTKLVAKYAEWKSALQAVVGVCDVSPNEYD